MKQGGMQKYLINWTKSFSDACTSYARTFRLCFENHVSDILSFLAALPQGSPTSPNLFAIVMAAILGTNAQNPSRTVYENGE
jgi:hypothetical protein